MKGEAALKQVIDPADNEQWEAASEEQREKFMLDLNEELRLTLRQLLGENGEVICRSWMEVEGVD
jgi:hypothetical protein